MIMKRISKILKNFLSRDKKVFFVFVLLMVIIACEKEYFPQPLPPKVAKQTNTLEVSYSAVVPLVVNNKFWKEADFIHVNMQNLNTDSLYGDGLLNMTGTKSGLISFNSGKDPDVTMKAAYDISKLYIFIQWTDNSLNPSQGNSILDGASDPSKPAESPLGWTSQGNTDRVALAFDIGGASGSAGTFVEKGCAASCHNNQMKTSYGKVDIWHWDLASSDALGYANDMICDATSGLSNDVGTAMSSRNKFDVNDNRSAPAFEWDGTSPQMVTRPDGKKVALDPAFYLFNKAPFKGNVVAGKEVYHNSSCGHCHGENGEGGDGEYSVGSAFNNIGFARKYSREGIKTFSSSEAHEGASNFNSLGTGPQDDLIAFIKGLGSLPGYYLTTPTGSSADVWSVSNVSRARIEGAHTVYQVILIRDLVTPNADDIQFSSPNGKSFPFGIALMDNDGKNHIGSFKETLTFK